MIETEELAPRRSFDPRWLPLAVTTIGSFMSILDTQIINIALPNILTHFDASLSSGQLVITAYVMALAVVIPLSGFLGERLGMKRLYMFTLTCFVAGSALCGLAWDVHSLVFFRILQGLGGGMLQPLGMALVFTMITPLERPRFIALLGIPTLLAPLIGPSLGGYIVEYASWRMIFLINVPIGIID
ncbi:MAG TPA: MFS transporter, partial [Dehalococcoidia bacterium]|nr:MFS transporter [Dehalococcoidia bacterium]